jgi:type IV pilus assembly protein PilC
MLKIGESTGRLEVALANVTYFYNREVNDGVAKAQAALQPALTLLLGLVLLWVMFAVLGPVYDTISKMKF